VNQGCLQGQPPGTVFAVLREFLLLQHGEDFAGERAGSDAGRVISRVERVADLLPRVQDVCQFAFGQVSGIDDAAQLLTSKAVEPGTLGV